MHDAPDSTINSNSQVPFDKDRCESTPLYSNAGDTGTLKLIVGFFFGFSITLTLALGVQLYYGKTQLVPHGSVACDSRVCSDIGVSILKQGGNAVDAAIAVAFCLGVVNPHVTGIGGGGLMLIYSQRERKVLDVIDFRVTRSNDSVIGVPGFVAGLYLAHQLYGVLPWNTLISPAHYIAHTGFEVSQTLMDSKSQLFNSRETQNLNEWFESITQVKEVISNIYLAETLASIATKGPSEFYSTILPEETPIHEEDIKEYKALRSTSLKTVFHNFDIFVPSHGSGGPSLVEHLKYVNDSYSPLLSAVTGFLHAAEEWPVSFGSHIATTDVNDVYVSLVSGLGSVLGSQILTPSGFILNNILQITLDTSERPEVLWTPVVASESGRICGRRLILGAGDVRDVAQALIYLLRYPTENITQSIEAARIRIITPHIALEKPMKISNDDYVKLNNLNLMRVPASLPFPSINVIQKIQDTIIAISDFRGNGSSVAF